MAQQTVLSPELQAIEREYGRNIRIVETRPKLQRFGILAAFIIEGAAIAFFLFSVMGYVISGSFDELRSAGVSFGANTAYFHAIAAQSDAQQMTLGSAKAVQGTPSSFDFFASIANPNEDWYATFTYTFTASGISTDAKDGAVMPGETSYLLSLGNATDARPSSVSVAVDNIVWHRVNRHIAPDVSVWLENHNAFIISEPDYAPDLDYAESKIGRTTFTVTNATPYAYWAAPFTVVLERAGAVVGISQATLTEFESGEMREADVRWYGDLPVSATATVVPAINYFDEDAYMPPRGTTGDDVRDSLEE